MAPSGVITVSEASYDLILLVHIRDANGSYWSNLDFIVLHFKWKYFMFQVGLDVEEKLGREEELGRTAVMLAVDQKLVAIGKLSKQGKTAVMLAVDQKLVAIGELSKQCKTAVMLAAVDQKLVAIGELAG